MLIRNEQGQGGLAAPEDVHTIYHHGENAKAEIEANVYIEGHFGHHRLISLVGPYPSDITVWIRERMDEAFARGDAEFNVTDHLEGAFAHYKTEQTRSRRRAFAQDEAYRQERQARLRRLGEHLSGESAEEGQDLA